MRKYIVSYKEDNKGLFHSTREYSSQGVKNMSEKLDLPRGGYTNPRGGYPADPGRGYTDPRGGKVLEDMPRGGDILHDVPRGG